MKNIKNYSPKDWTSIAKKFLFKIKGEVLSSCIDGRYSNKEALIAPRALPGADLGFLIVALGTLNELKKNNKRKFSLKFKQKVLKEILDLVGGPEKFMFHSDNHNLGGLALGCGHFNQVKNNPKAYGLTTKDINLILNFLKKIKKRGAKEIILNGEHNESIILVIESKQWASKRQFGKIQAFVFHKFLYEEFLNKLVLKLISWPEFNFLSLKKFKNLFLRVGKKQFNETLKKIAYNLPVLKIKEKNNKLAVAVGRL